MLVSTGDTRPIDFLRPIIRFLHTTGSPSMGLHRFPTLLAAERVTWGPPTHDRVPQHDGIGVAVTDRGFINVDIQTRANVPQAHVAAEVIAGEQQGADRRRR